MNPLRPGRPTRPLLRTLFGGLLLFLSACSKPLPPPSFIDDATLLNDIARRSFLMLRNEVAPATGFSKDRSIPGSAVSIAATGFALTAGPIGIENGWITRTQGLERTRLILDSLQKAAGQHEGFFYHFLTPDGQRENKSELSSVDTALLMAGVLFAGEYFKTDPDIASKSKQLFEAVNWKWMSYAGTNQSKTGQLYLGWNPAQNMPGGGDFLKDSQGKYMTWDAFNEGLLAYVLAAGSPTHPLTNPKKVWDGLKRIIVSVAYNTAFCPDKATTRLEYPSESLFIYQYPLAWLDLRKRKDGNNINYFQTAVQGSCYNHFYSTEHHYDPKGKFTYAAGVSYSPPGGRFNTYGNGIWGISASDGPPLSIGQKYYTAYGASPPPGLGHSAALNHDGTIAPYASIGSLPFTYTLSLRSVRAMKTLYGSKIWGRYGFTSAFNKDRNYYSKEYIGIDKGIELLMITNQKNAFVWNTFSRIPLIQTALTKLGFN